MWMITVKLICFLSSRPHKKIISIYYSNPKHIIQRSPKIKEKLATGFRTFGHLVEERKDKCPQFRVRGTKIKHCRSLQNTQQTMLTSRTVRVCYWPPIP